MSGDEYGAARYVEFDKLGEPCERRGDGANVDGNSVTLLAKRLGEVLCDTEYGLLSDRSLRILVLESLRAWSRCRFSSLCSGVRLPRGGLSDRDRAYIGMSFGSSYGVNCPEVIPGLNCC